MAGGINAIANLLGKVNASNALVVTLDGGAMSGSLLTVTSSGLGTTPTAGGIFQNTTAAAAGAQQISPSVDWVGQGWKTDATAASQEVRFRADVLPVQGTSAPTGTFRLGVQVASGAITYPLQVTSAGALTPLGQVLAANGSSTAPGLSFASEAGLGLFRNGTNDLRVAINGDARHIFTENAFTILSDTGRIDFGSGLDVSLARSAANRLRLASGDVFNLAPTAFASLPTGAEGDMASVTDSNTATWGATIAGGGANNVLAYFNGTNWTVAGA